MTRRRRGRHGPASYLATEQNFQVLKSLESKNLLVPVVGNFGGPKAIRAVGQFVSEHGSIVSAFYLSNVEMYLYQQNLWDAFCRNVATLPLDDASTFIRSSRGNGYGRGFGSESLPERDSARGEGLQVGRTLFPPFLSPAVGVVGVLPEKVRFH